MAELLLEIGTEEIPARFLPAAREALAVAASRTLEGARLAPESVRATGTPRRLVLIAAGIPERQPDFEETVTGPPWERAFDASGEPTKAGAGFAKKNGLDPTELEQIETHRGTVAGFTRLNRGRPAVEVIAEAAPDWIHGLPFGKNMRWEASGLRFARPIRWLVAMLDDAVLPVTIAGVEAGRHSRGHRFLGERFELAHATEYSDAVADQGVVLDPDERRRQIVEGGNALAKAAGLTVDWDPEVLAEVVDLVEQPGPLLGRFDEGYLELPDAVLEAPMKAHQRYFPTRTDDGRLAARFLFAANRADDPKGLIAAGNARVLSARLADAKFFWDQDRARSLEDHATELVKITWQEGLGTLDELRERVTDLSRDQPIRAPLGADPKVLDRAGELYLADLGTNMVYEFAELQGRMGAIYAELGGEPAAVVTAIAEAHRPGGADDALPESPAGCALALAHRIDLIVGNLLVGHEVKGNQDPFGMRRAALGCFRIQEATNLAAPLDGLCELHVERYRAAGVSIPPGIDAQIRDFWRGRLSAYLAATTGASQALCDAVVSAAGANATNARRRIEALEAYLADDSRREAFLDTYKRLRNIAKDADPFPPGELADWTDTDSGFFAAAVAAVAGALDGHLRDVSREDLKAWTESSGWTAETAADAEAALDRLSALEGSAERLFEEVRINAEDPAVQAARQRLVATARAVFDRMADFDRLISG